MEPSETAGRSAVGRDSAVPLLVAGLCGALLMALEILASRVLAPHFGNSVYVWGSIISVFLAAMSVGYAWGGRLADRRPEPLILGRIVLTAAVWILALRLGGAEVTRSVADLTGASPGGTLVACLLLFGVPGVLFGMVSPFVIRLAADSLLRLGKTSGRIYALSTVGSLAGTLLCTFYAIPRFTVGAILSALAIGTALTAALALAPRSRREGLLAVLVAVGIVALGSGAERSRAGVLAVRGTAYQTLEVIDRAGVRYLRSDDVTQGAFWIDSGDIYTRYIDYAAGVFLTTPDARSALAIGMGGGLLSKVWRRVEPEITIDYVEIDPVIPRVAERYGFWRPHPGDRVHIADGRRFLAQSDARWDVIYVDAYIGRSVPFHLTTREFFALARRHLAPGGTLALNLAAGIGDPFSRSLLHTLRRSFRTTLVFGVRGTGNVLVLGTRESSLDRGELAARAQAIAEPEIAADLAEIARRLVYWEYEARDVIELRDDFAPAEHLVTLGERDFDLERFGSAPD